jgi:hypothetical protein
MGEEVTVEMVRAKKKRLAEYLHRATTSADDSLRAIQRLAIWYRENGVIKIFEQDEYVRIDKPDAGSQFDITRPE